ncbi:hypothetical protein Tco_1060812 [Tanacetum coccineum]
MGRSIEKRSYPSEIYSNQKIVEVIRVNNEKGYGQDFMEEIIVKRVDGKAYIFLESNYKYLNKNDIEDMYLIWFMTTESYQIKINRTALTLVIPGIEKLESYTIITNPFIRIVNENSKNEKRVMNIEEFSKFCDATLKKFLRKVREINSEVRYGYKDPNLSAEDREIMEFIEEEI